MNITKIATAVIAVIATGFASQASATVFTYDLTDAAHGLGAGGFYERAVGQQGAHRGWNVYSFEQNGADVKLQYDDATGTAQIFGKGYNYRTGTFTEFDLAYDNILVTDNALRLLDMDLVGEVGDVGQFGEYGAAGATDVNGKGFNFALLGDSLTGHGWLNNLNGTHFGDFHLAGDLVANVDCAAGVGPGCGGGGGNGGGGNGGGGGEVPVPAPLSLIGAMALFGAWRRRRSIAG